MAEPGSDRRDTLDRLIAILGPRLDEVRSLARRARVALAGRRAARGGGDGRRIQELARELGLVTRDEWDELELRVAQLEHRLRLARGRATTVRP